MGSIDYRLADDSEPSRIMSGTRCLARYYDRDGAVYELYASGLCYKSISGSQRAAMLEAMRYAPWQMPWDFDGQHYRINEPAENGFTKSIFANVGLHVQMIGRGTRLTRPRA
jgi:hypothetical protein